MISIDSLGAMTFIPHPLLFLVFIMILNHAVSIKKNVFTVGDLYAIGDTTQCLEWITCARLRLVCQNSLFVEISGVKLKLIFNVNYE